MRYLSLALIALGTSQSVAAQTPTPPTAPSPCAASEHNQFDFWVGDWYVYASGTKPIVAHSKIEKLHNNCAVSENWMPLLGGGGSSLNGYSPETGLWHQVWQGSQPGQTAFSGGLTDGRMVLTGNWRNVNGPGKHALIRMSYSLEADGSVRQHGEQSIDHGLTWTTSFDFIYRKKSAL